MSATTFPCAAVIDCPCDDSPFENLSAEGVDSRTVPGFFYGCAGPDGIPAVCEAETTELAELCAARECDNYTLFYSQETTCACSTDPSITYTLPSGSFIALSQADADALAEAFACNVAELICDGSPMPELFESAPQTCEATCDGGTVSYSTIAGMFLGFTQAEADALALAFACDVAALLCADGPNNPTPVPLTSAFNGRQVCSIACEGIGAQFSYAVAAGVFRANNAAQANAMAYSYACRQAMAVRFCLGDEIDDRICISEAATFNISISGVTPDTRTWSITGTLPTGMTFANGVVSGTPAAAGSYTFTVRLTDGDGNYATRQYTIVVVAITNTSPLDELVLGVPYLVNFATSSGDQEAQQWTVISGNLPAGLTLEENGVLHGTPTETGEFPITVRVLDATAGFEPLSCMKDFTFASLIPSLYWNYEDVNAMFDEIENVEMTATVPVSDSGIIGNGFRFNGSVVDATRAVQALDSSELAYTAGQSWSAGFWIKINASGSNAAILMSFENSINDNELALEIVTGGALLRLTADSTAGGSDSVDMAFVPDVGNWHFYALTYDGDVGVLSLYRDAVLVLQTSPVVLATTATGTIGSLWVRAVFGNTLSYNLDELAVFMNKALSEEEIDFLYNSGVGRTWPW